MWTTISSSRQTRKSSIRRAQSCHGTYVVGAAAAIAAQAACPSRGRRESSRGRGGHLVEVVADRGVLGIVTPGLQPVDAGEVVHQRHRLHRRPWRSGGTRPRTPVGSPDGGYPPTVMPGSADSRSQGGETGRGDQVDQRVDRAHDGRVIESPGEGQRHGAEDRQPSGRVPSGSVHPGVVRPVRLALLEEGVAALGGFVCAVGESGGLTGKQLLPDEPIVDEVEGVLEHPLRRR